ncbi:hypothetical protein M5X06_12755 [Paenibacillus alvei]|uniref:NfeD-like C-terminal domain-containing protein n=1 Tax=Paenibacillus alvei TaxID=44250 RepID=A0ABT4GUL6_PAEAL|nr:hypothetical protein [Paenibacillus alvei]MCY9760390.1 hypothetical protein [Paenibacillus alvei]MCY9767682.1 hypothetical protein [Paenibacillus alvei]
MEIINTLGGAPISEVTFWGYAFLFLLILGVALIFISFSEEDLLCFLFGAVSLIIAIVLFSNGVGIRETDKLTPTKYEVLLREGAVIDATKYEIVEQRGKIYVIQEREASE